MIDVMIVEDDPMVAQLNKQYIELVDGFAVHSVVHRAAEALSLLNTCNIDLILLDLFMPNMNGIELLTKLRETGKGLDVLVVSAIRDTSTIMQVLRFGAIDYIIKPFEFPRLKDALMNYKELAHIIHKQDIMNQTDIDNYFYKDHPADLSWQLPKGINQATLKKSWDKIQEKETVFSTNDLASDVGISRVSMRKYLEFLRELGILELKLIYSAVGRPKYQYHCIKNNEQLIMKYI